MFEGYPCETDMPLYKLRVARNYVYSLFKLKQYKTNFLKIKISPSSIISIKQILSQTSEKSVSFKL